MSDGEEELMEERMGVVYTSSSCLDKETLCHQQVAHMLKEMSDANGLNGAVGKPVPKRKVGRPITSEKTLNRFRTVQRCCVC